MTPARRFFIKLVIIVSIVFLAALLVNMYYKGYGSGYKKGVSEPLCKNETIIYNLTTERIIEHTIECPVCVPGCRDAQVINSTRYRSLVVQVNRCENMLDRCSDPNAAQRCEHDLEELQACRSKLVNISELLTD